MNDTKVHSWIQLNWKIISISQSMTPHWECSTIILVGTYIETYYYCIASPFLRIFIDSLQHINSHIQKWKDYLSQMDLKRLREVGC